MTILRDTMRSINNFSRIRQAPWKNKNLLVFLVFLAISSGFWFLNALRKSYVTTISYPVKFIKFPDDKMLDADVLKYIDIKVRGVGFTLVRYRLGKKFIPIDIEASKLRSSLNGSKKGGYLVTANHLTRISAQLSSDLELLEVSPDTIFINWFAKSTKQIPVKLIADLQYQKQFQQGGAIVIQPNSVEVSGPENLMDSIQFVSTVSQRFENLADTLNKTFTIEPINGVDISIKKVSVSIPVEAFTESSFDVPILTRNVPDSLILKTFPSEIKVKFRVGLSRYDSIKPYHFQAYVDGADVAIAENQNKLKVKIDLTPDFIYSIEYSPVFVDYILERNR